MPLQNTLVLKTAPYGGSPEIGSCPTGEFLFQPVVKDKRPRTRVPGAMSFNNLQFIMMNQPSFLWFWDSLLIKPCTGSHR